MTQDTTKDKAKGSSPGRLTHLVVYVVAVTAMYFVRNPEVTGNYSEMQEHDFHIAAVSLAKDAKSSSYVAFSLTQLKTGKVELGSVSFLLPQGDTKIHIPGSNSQTVTVLERHPDWQLVEFHYWNTHFTISRYRAFKDRIEPVSYRMAMDMLLLPAAIVLLIPATVVSALINAIWKRVDRRRKTSDVA
jgi:hypothetical protein